MLVHACPCVSVLSQWLLWHLTYDLTTAEGELCFTWNNCFEIKYSLDSTVLRGFVPATNSLSGATLWTCITTYSKQGDHCVTCCLHSLWLHFLFFPFVLLYALISLSFHHQNLQPHENMRNQMVPAYAAVIGQPPKQTNKTTETLLQTQPSPVTIHKYKNTSSVHRKYIHSHSANLETVFHLTFVSNTFFLQCNLFCSDLNWWIRWGVSTDMLSSLGGNSHSILFTGECGKKLRCGRSGRHK